MISWVVTETQYGKELEVAETYSKEKALAILLDYTQEDRKQFSPCLYRKEDGLLTTEY